MTIRAVGISLGADPTLSLVGPPEQILAINDNVLSIPFSTAAQIVFRLQATGPHFIVVGGTPGDFFMTLENSSRHAIDHFTTRYAGNRQLSGHRSSAVFCLQH